MSTSVSFHNRRSQRLCGELHGTLGKVAAITCHGMLSTKDGTKHRLLARELEARGVPLLRFDFAGRGESEGSLLELSYSHQVEDLEAALDYLVASGVERVGLFGSSMGGTVALLTAARSERVVAIATLAAVAHPSAIFERYPAELARWRTRGTLETEAGEVGLEYLDDARRHDVIASTAALLAPLLVIHGERDELVPSSDAHDIAAAARNVSLEIVLGADHRFSDAQLLRPAMRRVAAFLAAHLGLASMQGVD